MKRIFLLFFVLPFTSYSQSFPCDTNIWQHVYHNQRLQVIEECKTVTGIIISEKREKDGDIHIRLRLDPGQQDLLNAANYVLQDTCLVLEPICINEATQADAKISCKGYVNDITIPPKGTHMKVTGSYVLDIQHGWNEIHPITSIIIL